MDKDNEDIGFFRYLVAQHRLIALAYLVATVCYVAMKYCFPLPDFFSDSFSYIAAATVGMPVSYRPTGYSDFLRLAHTISVPGNSVVLMQYALSFLGILFFFFSVDYLYRLQQKLRVIILLVLVANPLLVIQTNLISSDSLFCTVTIVWFTLCLWLVSKPSWWLFGLQLIVLYICFQIRYTAIFYPVVACISFLISHGRLVFRVIGSLCTILLVFVHVDRQMDIIEKDFNVRIYSGFSGWQLANNVLCYYNKISVDPGMLPTEETKRIDSCIKEHINDIRPFEQVNTEYLWDRHSPLKQYLAGRQKRTGHHYFYEWMNAGKDLSDYSRFLIKANPGAYIRYFMVPNFNNCILPHAEALSEYNNWNTILTPDAQLWFRFRSDRLYCRYPGLQKKISTPYPIVWAVLNLVNLMVIVCALFAVFRFRRHLPAPVTRLVVMWSVFYLCYILFSTFATIVLLRYMMPLFSMCLVMPLVLFRQYIHFRRYAANNS